MGGGTPTTGSFAIKDFKCLGKMTLPTYTPSKCNTGGTPPVGSGGSSGSTGTVSSSSSIL